MRTKEELELFLEEEWEIALRENLDSESSAYIHMPQINAAKEVVTELACNTLRTNHVILVAKMQSGKTGTCNAITNLIFNTSLKRELAVNKVLYITGMNDCGLANQTYQRVLEQVTKASKNNTTDGTRYTSNIRNPKFYVLKNSSLKTFDGNLNGTLIFIDESHFGSKERNVLTKFMNAHGIDWKNRADLIANNIYIISVSATPFEEIISDTIDSKPMVSLKTDENYVGVSEYFEKELIHAADKDDINNGAIFEYIQDACERMEENSEKGIVIVRTRKFEPFYENRFITDNFVIHQMFANGSKIEYDKLTTKMQEMIEKNNANNKAFYRTQNGYQGEEVEVKPLLVLIKGAFRAGITIPSEVKDLIYMLYDYSTGADTTAQALLGRMCGYRDIEHSVFNSHFYVNSRMAHMYAEWENDFTNKELIPCSRTKWVWVDNDYVGYDVKLGTKPCGNFTVDLDKEDIRDIYITCSHAKNQREKMIEILPSILRKYNKVVPYDYFLEAYMSGRNNYAKSTQAKRFESFSSESLVAQFTPDKIKEFKEDTGRDYLTNEDLGKRAVSVMFDVTIETVNGRPIISGNKRLLIYYVEVGQKKRVANHQTQYCAHKDTALV